MSSKPPPSSPFTLVLVAVIAALLGFAGSWAWQASPMGRDASGEAVRTYLLDHPEILPEAMERLEAKHAAARLAPIRDQVEEPFPGAVLGNPQGSRILVEFSDYACGYCRQSMADVDAMIAADPQLKVVIREFPILSAASVEAARMALAAAEQGKYDAFHKAMYAAGRVSTESIESAAKSAGLDLARARAAAASGAVEAELSRNARIGEALGFSGTPSWVAGDKVLNGAVGKAALTEALGGPNT